MAQVNSDKGEPTGIVTALVQNVRPAPSTSTPIIGKLKRVSTVKILEELEGLLTVISLRFKMKIPLY